MLDHVPRQVEYVESIVGHGEGKDPALWRRFELGGLVVGGGRVDDGGKRCHGHMIGDLENAPTRKAKSSDSFVEKKTTIENK